MRAAGPPPAPRDDGFRGDVWTIAANHHLQAHITHRLDEDPRRYGRPASAAAMRAMSRELHPNADASPEFIANVGLLVAAKNAWAADMRQYGEEAPVDVQTQCWNQHAEAAEKEIAERMR
jgi:hypothetical protein